MLKAIIISQDGFQCYLPIQNNKQNYQKNCFNEHTSVLITGNRILALNKTKIDLIRIYLYHIPIERLLINCVQISLKIMIVTRTTKYDEL
jgi:hypothetical protein